MSRRVMIIDDDRLSGEEMEDTVREMGFECRYVTRGEDGLAAIQAGWCPHAVLLDQRLDGRLGGDTGLDLMEQIGSAQPECRVILVTAYPETIAVERAFARGAYDYLQKGVALTALLRHKLPDAVRLAEVAYGPGDAASRERELREAWDEAGRSDDLRKGAMLERTVELLLGTIPGFRVVKRNVGNRHEEIDVCARNESTDPLLSRQGDYLLVECKNEAEPTGVPKVRAFEQKMARRYGRCRLGIFVSMNGFARTVREDLVSLRGGDRLLVLVSGADVGAWVTAADRVEWLKERIEDAMLR